MNTEYVWWFVILAAVGVGVVAYLALGPVPEIPDAADDANSVDERSGSSEIPPAVDGMPPAGDGAAVDQSSPVSTTEPGPGAPSSTSETP